MIKQEDINKHRYSIIPNQNLLIGENWVSSKSGKTQSIISPIDGKIISELQVANNLDVNEAVLSAREVFDKGHWSNMPPLNRKKIMLRIAEIIEEKILELTVLGVRDNGTEFNMALRAEPGSAAGTFRYYAEAIDKIYGEVSNTSSDFIGLIQKEPVGVVAAIVPWNFPLMIGAWKIAPALAMGNSVIIKPSEAASLSLLKLGEICLEAGLPPGTLNIVTGNGKQTGQALARHMDVDVLTFTGSGNTGRQLLEYSAQSNMKRIYQELGGKSPNIIFADAENLEEAAKVSTMGIFRNSGEVCVAGSRLLVEDKIHNEFLKLVSEYSQKLKIGDPLEIKNDVGAINSLSQLQSDLDFVEKAKSEGGNIEIGGNRILKSSGGFYMEPTIISSVKQDTEVFQNEVFGPILTVTAFSNEDEAIKLANGTDFGLASGIWTSNLSRAHKMVKKIKAGTVFVNTYGGSDNTIPLTGVKQSGNGSDKSLHALDKFTDLKSVWMKL
ncbi:MAG: aldehyde dehydrogenase family protein [Candidatus Puniceispirillales bacterium]|jgi:gamma-glutamyl-gamma-aminobutyraldehyde dehydrogenase|tara:strand:+ start:500 stop:1987 length:1488 start_codon:yes stop_codon:yes gene_type:complete